MDGTLIGNGFNDIGLSWPRCSLLLFEGLNKSDKIKIEKIDLAIKKAIKSSYIGFGTLNRYLYFIQNKNAIRNKNVHILYPGVIPPFFLNLARKKIVTIHDLYYLEPNFNINRTKNFITNRVATKYLKKRLSRDHNPKNYDYVITSGETTKEKIIKHFGVSGDNIGIVPYIIPEKFFVTGTYTNKSKKRIIGYINGQGFNKTPKLKLFIEHFKKFKNNDIEFHIYGKGFPFQNLIKDTNIKYFGFLPENKLVDTLSKFDAYLSTSTIEGFGLPIIQAKACKVPVLCYDGDIPQLVKRNTLLWKDDNLLEIIKNRSWEKVDVEKAYLDAEECRADKVVPKIIEVYKKVFE